MTKTALPLKKAIAIFVLSLSCFSGHAQVAAEVQQRFEQYHSNTLQEKVFVHTDKDTYLPGELLWFKAYSTDARNRKPLSLNRVMYVEVIDAGRHAVLQASVNLKDGLANGSLQIPSSVSTGNYQLRAYTSWMKNFSPDLYFEKNITVINPFKASANSAKPSGPAFDVQFFPEGGEMVKGISSRIGFKAVGRDGAGLSVSGAVLNQQNDTVARFRSLKFGMGSFDFTPGQAGAYTVVVAGGNSQVRKQLPSVNTKGYTLRVYDGGAGKLDVLIRSAGMPDGNVYAFIYTGQHVVMAQSVKLTGGSAQLSVAQNALGEGVSHVILFDAEKRPVCERLCFKRPQQKLILAATTGQQQYAPRKKVTVKLTATTDIPHLPPADLSMSVYRADSLQGEAPGDIFTYLWLSSELKGRVENAGYYFNNQSPETSQALDNLMLTQGWRQFQWKALTGNSTEKIRFLPEYAGQIISARIVDAATNKPANQVSAYLSIPGKRLQTYLSVSDQEGLLHYNTRDFYSAGELIVQADPVAGGPFRIEVLSPYSSQFSASQIPAFRLRTGILPDLKEHSRSVQVLNLYHREQLREFERPVVDSSAFYGTPSKIYHLDDFTRFTTMEEVLREYVKEDNIVKSKGKFHIRVLTENGFLDSGDPLVLMDGVPVFDMNKVMGIDPLKVNKLEILAAKYNYGTTVASGIFSFSSYKADLAGMEPDPSAAVVDYEGLQLTRIFYAPAYETTEQAASRRPDYRNLLFWAPSVHADGDISFYTSDLHGKYIGIIQGINTNGDAASGTFSFEVK